MIRINREFISFTKSERRGVLVLLCLLAISIAYHYFVPGWISKRALIRFEQMLEKNVNEESSTDVFDDREVQLVEDDRELVLPVVQEKQETFAEINEKKNVNAYRQMNIIDLNQVTAGQLIKTGLFSREIAFRIIKFRNGLGGFYSLEQLKEVFGYPVATHHEVLELFKVDAYGLKKIEINRSSREELEGHPYISKNLAGQIINFRTNYKQFERAEDVLELYLVNEELYDKLIPYVVLD